jgi:hypothetical protein
MAGSGDLGLTVPENCKQACLFLVPPGGGATTAYPCIYSTPTLGVRRQLDLPADDN